MAKSQKAYFGLGFLVSLILAIFPLTSVICGIITRVQRGHIISAICNLVFSVFFWIVDLVCIILKKDITFFA